MNLSLGEFRSLVAKAFRGAGYSWGLTEDAGFAAARLAEFDIDVAPMVVRLLERTDGMDKAALMPGDGWQSVSGLLCPASLGASVVDLDDCPDTAFENLLEPLLFAPFLLSLVESKPEHSAYEMNWNGGGCTVGASGVFVEGSVPIGQSSVAVTVLSGCTRGDVARRERVQLDEVSNLALTSFAQRTYAPATEASRVSGAGAGLLDED